MESKRFSVLLIHDFHAVIVSKEVVVDRYKRANYNAFFQRRSFFICDLESREGRPGLLAFFSRDAAAATLYSRRGTVAAALSPRHSHTRTAANLSK